MLFRTKSLLRESNRRKNSELHPHIACAFEGLNVKLGNKRDHGVQRRQKRF
jgi:hypothetical protein